MDSERGSQVYAEFGAKPIINAVGHMTVLGGSRLSPTIQEAMVAANRYFVDMEELFKKTGAAIADMLGAEAAFVTPGCAAAISLSAAACMTGSDPAKIDQLPDTTGMKDEILIQTRQRYHYDRCLTVFGAKLVEVGTDSGTNSAQLQDAITDTTAAIHYFAPGGADGVLPLEECIRIGKAHGVPVIVDAASQIYPLERFYQYIKMGASLVGYGAKYFGACNSTGVLCGSKELVDAAYLHSFIGYESTPNYPVGRPLKLDRQEVIAVAVALREWVSMDHDERIAGHWRKTDALQRALADIPNVTTERVIDERSLGNGLRVTLNENKLGKTVVQIADALSEGDPGILANSGGNSIHFAVAHLLDEDIEIIAERLRALLTA